MIEVVPEIIYHPNPKINDLIKNNGTPFSQPEEFGVLYLNGEKMPGEFYRLSEDMIYEAGTRKGPLKEEDFQELLRKYHEERHSP